jgi:hypothetical protein
VRIRHLPLDQDLGRRGRAAIVRLVQLRLGKHPRALYGDADVCPLMARVTHEIGAEVRCRGLPSSPHRPGSHAGVDAELALSERGHPRSVRRLAHLWNVGARLQLQVSFAEWEAESWARPCVGLVVPRRSEHASRPPARRRGTPPGGPAGRVNSPGMSSRQRRCQDGPGKPVACRPLRGN